MPETSFEWVKTAAQQNLFLDFADRLYPPQKRTQNRTEMKQLLTGSHALSRYFTMHALLLYAEGQVVARCAITLYPGSTTAYLGLYECEDHPFYAGQLLREAERKARELGCIKITGPVNASFWNGYRMKANRFEDAPYFSEPYNLPYYVSQWQDNGYVVSDLYVSNIYSRLRRDYSNPKYEARLAEFEKQGYIIRSPRRREWSTVVRKVWQLLMELYSDFPVFAPISEEDFARHYSSLAFLLDFKMTKMAYYKGEAVGFFLGIPDYGNLAAIENPGMLRLLKVLLQRQRSRRYIMLYMGVLPQHRGLGKAITQTIIQTVAGRQGDAVGAFIHEGRPTQRYVEDMISNRYEYLLFKKELAESE